MSKTKRVSIETFAQKPATLTNANYTKVSLILKRETALCRSRGQTCEVAAFKQFSENCVRRAAN